MVSNFGISTCNGSVYTRGRGTMRKIAGNVLGSLGHMLINRVANAISGSGIHRRRTYRKRTTTHRRGGSYRPVGTGTGRRKTYRRKTISTVRRTHRKVGGYKKRVGKPRTRKTRRISTVRRRRILII